MGSNPTRVICQTVATGLARLSGAVICSMQRLESNPSGLPTFNHGLARWSSCKTSALPMQMSWVRIPPECGIFHRALEITEYTILNTLRCKTHYFLSNISPYGWWRVEVTFKKSSFLWPERLKQLFNNNSHSAVILIFFSSIIVAYLGLREATAE